MLRLVLALVVMLSGISVAHAASDGERKTCFNSAAKPEARMSACGKVLSDLATSGDDRVVALYTRSGLLIERRQYEAAISDLDQLLAIRATHAAGYNRRGLAKTELNRIDQALADYDKAIASDPNLVVVYNNRGNAFRARGEFDRALADFAEALRRDPYYVWALRNRGYAYERMGMFADAERTYRQVLATKGRPGNPDDRRARADALSDLRRIAGILQARAKAYTRAALIIANSNYKGDTFDPLATPAKDARDVAAALGRLGFKQQDVTIKLDLDRRGMVAALREFESKAASVDWALVFFAGHGVRARSSLDYMIPIDAEITSERDLEDEAVALERVAERIRDAKRLQLIVFDACRSNELTRRLYASGEAQRGTALAKAPFEAPGLMLAFSARRGQSAFDGREHSPFVDGLLANIEQPGADLETIFTRTAEHVRKATREQQTPEIFGLGYGKGLVLKAGVAQKQSVNTSARP